MSSINGLGSYYQYSYQNNMNNMGSSNRMQRQSDNSDSFRMQMRSESQGGFESSGISTRERTVEFQQGFGGSFGMSQQQDSFGGNGFDSFGSQNRMMGGMSNLEGFGGESRFSQIGMYGDANINSGELRDALGQIGGFMGGQGDVSQTEGIEPPSAEDMFTEIDSDGDGSISQDEFLSAVESMMQNAPGMPPPPSGASTDTDAVTESEDDTTVSAVASTDDTTEIEETTEVDSTDETSEVAVAATDVESDETTTDDESEELASSEDEETTINSTSLRKLLSMLMAQSIYNNQALTSSTLFDA